MRSSTRNADAPLKSVAFVAAPCRRLSPSARLWAAVSAVVFHQRTLLAKSPARARPDPRVFLVGSVGVGKALLGLMAAAFPPARVPALAILPACTGLYNINGEMPLCSKDRIANGSSLLRRAVKQASGSLPDKGGERRSAPLVDGRHRHLHHDGKLTFHLFAAPRSDREPGLWDRWAAEAPLYEDRSAAGGGSISGKSISVPATLFMKSVRRNCTDRATISMIWRSLKPTSRTAAKSASVT